MAIKGTLFKAGGYYSRYKAITKISAGTVFIIIGIVFVIMSIIKSIGDTSGLLLLGIIIGLAMIIAGIFNIINGIIIWKRSASFVQGKFM